VSTGRSEPAAYAQARCDQQAGRVAGGFAGAFAGSTGGSDGRPLAGGIPGERQVRTEMTSPIVHGLVRRALMAGIIAVVCAGVIGGGFVIANAWVIGESISQPSEPSIAVPPAAQRRWYARGLYFASERTGSPVPAYVNRD
jgi:hypothetical protein